LILHRVADRGSNAPENIELAVQAIGRSRVKRAVFAAVHKGRKQAKTVDEIAAATREGRQQVLNAAGALAQQGIIQAEKRGRTLAYRRDPFYQANRDTILRFVDNPGSIERLPTKRRPEGRAGIKVLQIPVSRNRIQAKAITIDDIQSFAKVRSVRPGAHVGLRESAIKEGLLRIIGDRGRFKDWGGERNDFLTGKLLIRGRRRVAAFALKGPGISGLLTPARMGTNGDQIQRLAQSPAQVLVVQYHGQVADSVREQVQLFAQLKSVWESRPIWFCIIDGDDTSRLLDAYPAEFKTKGSSTARRPKRSARIGSQTSRRKERRGSKKRSRRA
jgi:hypothetical protein